MSRCTFAPIAQAGHNCDAHFPDPVPLVRRDQINLPILLEGLPQPLQPHDITATGFNYYPLLFTDKVDEASYSAASPATASVQAPYVLAAGITVFGTAGAAACLTTDARLETISTKLGLQNRMNAPEMRDFEALLRVVVANSFFSDIEILEVLPLVLGQDHSVR